MNESAFLNIVIPAYKREELLGKLLNSIGMVVPVIVIDNGGHLSEAFTSKYKNIKFISGPEVDMFSNWNRAALASDSEWVLMPGDDDLYYEESMSIIKNELMAHPSADIVFFGHNIINGQDEIQSTWVPGCVLLDPPMGFEVLRRGTPARPPAIAFKKNLFEKLNGFSEEFKITAADNDFYQRASLVGRTAFIDKVVAGYRVWENGATKQTIATQDWLREIDLWCDRMRDFSQKNTEYCYPRSLKDGIYLDNLRVGINTLKKHKGHRAAWKHFRNSRYPFLANPVAQLKLLLALLMPNQSQ